MSAFMDIVFWLLAAPACCVLVIGVSLRIADHRASRPAKIPRAVARITGRESARQYAIANAVCMDRRWGCDDCDDTTYANYMVNDAVWALTGAPRFGCLLCKPCLETRIGRPLRPEEIWL